MNIQLKKGLVEVCVLASLMREASYGYKIISDISPVIEISESTLYPILRRLETNGFLITYDVNFNGRVRKYYEITNLGQTKVKDFIDEWKEMEAVYSFIKGRCF